MKIHHLSYYCSVDESLSCPNEVIKDEQALISEISSFWSCNKAQRYVDRWIASPVDVLSSELLSWKVLDISSNISQFPRYILFVRRSPATELPVSKHSAMLFSSQAVGKWIFTICKSSYFAKLFKNQNKPPNKHHHQHSQFPPPFSIRKKTKLFSYTMRDFTFLSCSLHF